LYDPIGNYSRVKRDKTFLSDQQYPPELGSGDFETTETSTTTTTSQSTTTISSSTTTKPNEEIKKCTFSYGE